MPTPEATTKRMVAPTVTSKPVAKSKHTPKPVATKPVMAATPIVKTQSAAKSKPAPKPVAKPQPLTGSCNIKGNIAKDGEKIYHVPGQRYYSATKIDLGKGERWFCSTEDATNAGWRPAKV